MQIIVEKQWYSIKLCKENPQNLYIFGENQSQQGTKSRGYGQAIIRECDNSFGFCTKNSISFYWSDKEYEYNKNQIEKDINSLKKLSEHYTLVFPYNGLGTGLSKLPQKAPLTFLYLTRRLIEVFGYNNIENLTSE